MLTAIKSRYGDISIHTPHAGSDAYPGHSDCAFFSFQSTLPMRGVTVGLDQGLIIFPISIHTPHAGSDMIRVTTSDILTISIHTPHAGSDYMALVKALKSKTISIHTPHAGSDGL